MVKDNMTEETKKVPSLIDEISADLGIYTEPNLLKDDLGSLLDTASANMDGIKKYQQLLSNVRYAWQKTLKYTHYFNTFYPPTDTEIENFEALNHHIHAYLQDMTILKNKIGVLLGEMKNDIKKVAANKEEIDAFFKAGVEKTKEVFGGVSEHRDTHHHRGMRFFDGDLLRAENAHGELKILSTVFREMLNPEYKDELFAKLEKEKLESFETGKTRWIEMAQKNDEQASGYLNALLDGIRPSLYQFLRIKPVREVIDDAGKKI